MPTGNPTNILERIERHAGELRDDECWLNDYSTKPGGYKQVWSHDHYVYVHRVAWEAHNAEPIPDGMVVMHTCDNPGCFNPEHLVLGTQQDNIDDAMAKGRMVPGPGRPKAA